MDVDYQLIPDGLDDLAPAKVRAAFQRYVSERRQGSLSLELPTGPSYPGPVDEDHQVPARPSNEP